MNSKRKYLILVFGLATISIPSHALGDPEPLRLVEIDEASQTITITGNFFSNASPHQPQVWDTVDNQNDFNKLSDNSIVPTDSGPWTTNGNPWSNPITIDKTSSNQRTPGSSISYAGEAKGYVGWPRAFKESQNDTLYVSWWFKSNIHPDSAGGHNKFIRIWDDPKGEHTRIAWTNVLMAGEWVTWPGEVGVWNRMEIYVGAEDQSGTRPVTAWTNGTLTANAADSDERMDNTGLTIGLIGFDPNYIDNYTSMRFYLDDIYVSSSPARIELSNEPQWSKIRKNKEIQPPIDWFDNEVTARLNLGQFKDYNGDLYLYVIDNEGKVNESGLKLSICEKCPEPPEISVE